MKKAIAIFITLVLTASMVLSMAVPVFAANINSVEDVAKVIKAHAGDIAGIQISAAEYSGLFPNPKATDEGYFELSQSEVEKYLSEEESNGGGGLIYIYKKLDSDDLKAEIQGWIGQCVLVILTSKNEVNSQMSDIANFIVNLRFEIEDKAASIAETIAADLMGNSQGSIFSNNPSMPFLVVIVVEAIAIVALIVMNRRKSLILQKNGLLAEKE